MIKINFPDKLVSIPTSYFEKSDQPGKLINLRYSTYESKTYLEKKRSLSKRAVVYLPYGYDEKKKYNVVYLMHGGWSNETTYLGIPGKPHSFKNVLDNAIAAGKMVPMIVVCPTYNNLSDQDSSDYGLALKLTANYHHELINDLLSAVEGTYSTFAVDNSKAALKASRDHRAFVGLSMGSVATWRTLQYCLDYFAYFMPSSGSLTSDSNYLASMVKKQGYHWYDFFIFAASGTEDFAYPSFSQQIKAMKNDPSGIFRYANNSDQGNLYYLVQKGNQHNLAAAQQYFYNGMISLWHLEG